MRHGTKVCPPALVPKSAEALSRLSQALLAVGDHGYAHLCLDRRQFDHTPVAEDFGGRCTQSQRCESYDASGFGGGYGFGSAVGDRFQYSEGRIMVVVGAHLGRDLRGAVFTRIQSLSLSFLDKQRVGDLMNRINHDTRHVQSFLQHQLPDLVTQSLLLLGVIVVLLVQSWQLALLILIPAPFIVWLSNVTRRKVRRMYRQQWRSWDEANSVLQDILSGIRVVKSFGAEDIEVERFTQYSAHYRDLTARNESAWNTLYPSLSFIMGLGNFLILYYGGKLVQNEVFQMGELIQFSAYAGLLYGPLQFMSFIPLVSSRHHGR